MYMNYFRITKVALLYVFLLLVPIENTHAIKQPTTVAECENNASITNLNVDVDVDVDCDQALRESLLSIREELTGWDNFEENGWHNPLGDEINTLRTTDHWRFNSQRYIITNHQSPITNHQSHISWCYRYSI